MPCPTFPSIDQPNEMKLGRFNLRMTLAEVVVLGVGIPILLGITVGVLLDSLELGVLSLAVAAVVDILGLQGIKQRFGSYYLFEIFVALGWQSEGPGIASCMKNPVALSAEPVAKRCFFRGGKRDLGMVEPMDQWFPPSGFSPSMPLQRLRLRDPGVCIGKRMGGDVMKQFVSRRKSES